MSARKKYTMRQFGPTEKHRDYPGVYGWGIDTNGFRIVIYGTPKDDHESVKAAIKFLSRSPLDPTPEDISTEHPDFQPRNRDLFKRKSADEIHRLRNRGEHAPAHVHVYDKKSGREDKFELVEHHQGHHHAMLLPHESKYKPLTPGELRAVQPILDKTAGDFIQLWRELYEDSRLSRYVTRVSKAVGSDTIDRIDSNGDLVCTSTTTGRMAVFPPPINGKGFSAGGTHYFPNPPDDKRAR